MGTIMRIARKLPVIRGIFDFVETRRRKAAEMAERKRRGREIMRNEYRGVRKP